MSQLEWWVMCDFHWHTYLSTDPVSPFAWLTTSGTSSVVTWTDVRCKSCPDVAIHTHSGVFSGPYWDNIWRKVYPSCLLSTLLNMRGALWLDKIALLTLFSSWNHAYWSLFHRGPRRRGGWNCWPFSPLETMHFILFFHRGPRRRGGWTAQFKLPRGLSTLWRWESS